MPSFGAGAPKQHVNETRATTLPDGKTPDREGRRRQRPAPEAKRGADRPEISVPIRATSPPGRGPKTTRERNARHYLGRMERRRTVKVAGVSARRSKRSEALTGQKSACRFARLLGAGRGPNQRENSTGAVHLTEWKTPDREGDWTRPFERGASEGRKSVVVRLSPAHCTSATACRI